MYNLKLTVVLVFVLAGICSSFLYGQTRMGTRDLNRVGDQYFDMDQFSRATSFYEQSLKINNKDGHANYHLGECYRNLFDYGTAEVYYKRTSQLEPKKYPLSLYYFALMQKLNGKFDQAMLGFDAFTEFVKTYPQNKTLAKNTHLKEQAHIDKEGCILALNQLSHPFKDFKFQRMPEPINSESMDYAPSVYETEDMIAFTSGRAAAKGKSFNQRLGESFSDIFLYEKVDNVWQPVKRKDENFKIINSKWGDGSGTFNHDKTKYYYTNCHQDLGSSCHIYLSTKVDGKWRDPVALNSNINLSSHSSKQPTLSQGGDTLFFSSNRPGGIGMEDIWMSISAGNDGWGPPINMGPQVNTKLQEITPFFSEKDETLFFASNGHRGFGGFDIFMAKGRSFMDPEIYNMGYPFNSNKDEMYLYMGRTIGFVTSNRKGGSGKFDIFSFEIETEEAVIAEVDNEESIAGRNSIFSDDFEFDSDDRVQIEKIISLVVASHLYGVDLAFTDTELAFYESLTQDDKDRIERIVNSKIRNFSDSDLTAMRDEDAFYYDNLSDQDRAHVNSIIDSYMEDRGLTASVTLNAEDRSFYNRLSQQDQEKVSRIIARGMQQGDLSIYYGESAKGRQYFDGLSSSDQERIDRLAGAFLEGKANFPNSALNSADRSYYESLSSSQKQSVDAAIQNRIRNLGQTGPFALNQEDLDFYQSLNPEQRAGFDQLATAYMLAELNTLSENLGTDDLSFYQELSSIRQEVYDKILAKKIKNIGDADQYRFSILTSDERVRIDRMVDALNLAGSFANLPGLLTGSDKVYYNQLVPNEKNGLHRMIKARSKAGEVIPITASETVVAQTKTDDNSGDLSNHKFDSQEITKIEEVISKMVISRLYGVELAFTDVQLNFYQNLSSKDRETMERIVDSRVRNLTDSDLTALRDEDQFYYNNLSESDQQHINNMVYSYYQVRELGSSV
ncbi:MAG: hypothetical protein O6848_04760, partial [Bacteroidetes bacterium]|nr:hypothetical protein [Bacteroidota bacterium]